MRKAHALVLVLTSFSGLGCPPNKASESDVESPSSDDPSEGDLGQFSTGALKDGGLDWCTAPEINHIWNRDQRFDKALVFDGAERFGVSVAGLGDVDSDGHDDIGIGAVPSDGEGLVEIYLAPSATGGMAGSVEMMGEQAGDLAGWSVIGADDWNGDGYLDVSVGAPGLNNHAGAVYVVYGPFADEDARALSDSSVKVVGDSAGMTLGWALSNAHGLGAPDDHWVIVGAPSWTSAWDSDAARPDSEPGQVLLMRAGDSRGADIWLESTDHGDFAGFSIGAGDLDGDGQGEIAVGAPWATGGGAVYVLTGKPRSIDTIQAAAALVVTGISSGDLAGAAVALGDLNGDGLDDLVIGAPGYDPTVDGSAKADAGGVFVFYGRTNWSSASSLSLDDADLAVVGGAEGAWLGYSVALPGDVDGDGVPDLLVGAPFASDIASKAGSLWLVSGDESGRVELSEGSALTAYGTEANGWLGYAVAGAGDLNGDGYADVLAGAYHGGDDGHAGLFFGWCQRKQVRSGVGGDGDLHPRLR